MKIFFLNPPFLTEHGVFSRPSRSPSIGHSGVLYYPLGLIYAAAAAEQAGFPIQFFDACAKRADAGETLRIIREAGGADLFVLETSTPSIESDAAFGAAIKAAYPGAFVLLVGTHPSALPEETLRLHPAIDGVARGEYDFIVRDLAAAIENGSPLDAVRGLCFRRGNAILHNDPMPLIENMDVLPLAAPFIRTHLNPRDYVFPAAAYPAIQIFTGRGCPCRCDFCVYPQTMHGHAYRCRSAESVAEEFAYIAKHFPDVKEVVIEDDTFTVDPERVLRICRELRSRGLEKRLRWLCNARSGLSYDVMREMRQAGCHLIVLGIESASPDILRAVHKGATVPQTEAALKGAKRAGLMVHACYMVGNPGETPETMRRTLKAALRYRTDTAQFFPLMPYPGTRAFAWAKENNYLRGGYRDYCKEDGTLGCVVETPELSAQALTAFCAAARKRYYLRPWYIAHRLRRGLADFEDMKRSIKAFKTLAATLWRKQ